MHCACTQQGDGRLAVAPDVAFELEDGLPSSPSGLLHDAFCRYRALIFQHKPAPASPWQSLPLLSRVVVAVASSDESLQLGTDESYELVIPDNESDASIKAETVYGVLHALEVGGHCQSCCRWRSACVCAQSRGSSHSFPALQTAHKGGERDPHRADGQLLDLQTLSQLCLYNFTAKHVEIRGTPWHISDAPRFLHRGLLLDTARHYDPLPLVKQVIDSLSYAKLNVLHWHMEDTEAFPVEVPSFPKLWQGAFSPQERFTIMDLNEIVEYGRRRGVRVMAELDVPGHARSWGVGYPKLWPANNCTQPLDVSSNFTFDVIDGILTDFRDTFSYGLLHLGGDEVDTSCWMQTPHIRDWLEERGWSSRDAYKYFVLRVQELAVKKGWDPVNWEETFDEFGKELHPRTIVHNWLGPRVAPRIVAAGYRCIVSNQDRWYLDHLDVRWQEMYGNEPLEGIEDVEEKARVVGGEVCMWGETADSSNILLTIWPRAAAAAERLWSRLEDVEEAEEADVEERLQHFRCQLLRRNIPAGPVSSVLARAAPNGPGSCSLQ
eukprot:SM000027S09724  [mRNA]  locus=s27:934334:937835:- [translate_table: standard]